MNVSSSATNEQSNSKKNNKNNKKQQQQHQLTRSNTTTLQNTKSLSSPSSLALASSKQHLNNITNSLNSPDAAHKLMHKSNSNDNKYSSVYYVSPKMNKKPTAKKNNDFVKNKQQPIKE